MEMTALKKNSYQMTFEKFSSRCHSRCTFCANPPVDKIELQFDSQGVFKGTILCSEKQQGYDGMVHGGILAGVIDASMAQCLMGHAIEGYTTELAVKYKKPCVINIDAFLETKIVSVDHGCLYSMQARIVQHGEEIVTATAKFFKMN